MDYVLCSKDLKGRGPNSRGSKCLVQPLTPICQIKIQVLVKDRERLTILKQVKQAFQPIFGVQIGALGLNRGRIGKRFKQEESEST
jgi:hypothetical protein